MLDGVREPSDGSPLADRKWPPATPRAGSPGTPSTTPGRSRTGPSPGSPDPVRRRATSVAATRPSDRRSARSRPPPRRSTARRRRPAARSSRTPVSPSAFESLRPSGRRISGWWGKRGGRSRPSSRAEPDLRRRRVEQVAAADDEVDPLAQVVDDDRERVGPVAVAVADRRGRPRRRRRPTHGPTSPSIQASCPPPRRDPQRSSPARHGAGSRPGSRARPRDRASRAHAANVARVQSQPYDEPRRRERRRAPPRTASSRRIALADRARRPARTRATRGPRGAPRRTRAGSAAGRGPRSAGAPGRRSRAPCPTPRSRSRRARGGGSRSAPARTASRVRPSAPAASVRSRRRGAVGRARSARPGAAVARLERPGRGHQPPVEREQVGLGHRARVGHRDPQQDLALALGVADRPAGRRAPSRARPRGPARPAR